MSDFNKESMLESIENLKSSSRSRRRQSLLERAKHIFPHETTNDSTGNNVLTSFELHSRHSREQRNRRNMQMMEAQRLLETHESNEKEKSSDRSSDSIKSFSEKNFAHNDSNLVDRKPSDTHMNKKTLDDHKTNSSTEKANIYGTYTTTHSKNCDIEDSHSTYKKQHNTISRSNTVENPTPSLSRGRGRGRRRQNNSGNIDKLQSYTPHNKNEYVMPENQGKTPSKYSRVIKRQTAEEDHISYLEDLSQVESLLEMNEKCPKMLELKKRMLRRKRLRRERLLYPGKISSSKSNNLTPSGDLKRPNACASALENIEKLGKHFEQKAHIRLHHDSVRKNMNDDEILDESNLSKNEKSKSHSRTDNGESLNECPEEIIIDQSRNVSHDNNTFLPDPNNNSGEESFSFETKSEGNEERLESRVAEPGNNSVVDDEFEEIETKYCELCDKSFAPPTFKRICETLDSDGVPKCVKMYKNKRKIFSSAKVRIGNNHHLSKEEQQNVLKSRKKVVKEMRSRKKGKKNPKSKGKWRQQSNEFREAMKVTHLMEKAKKEGKPAHSYL